MTPLFLNWRSYNQQECTVDHQISKVAPTIRRWPRRWNWIGRVLGHHRTMQCPQCGAQTPDEEWNCASCRINIYWASQHYEDLARIRQGQGLPTAASTPSFLVQAHERAMNERADHGGRVEHRVRQIARRAMRRAAGTAGRGGPEPVLDQETDLEAAWNTSP
jgi:hypothetical protein